MADSRFDVVSIGNAIVDIITMPTMFLQPMG